MRQVEVIGRVPIRDLEDWRRYAGPQRQYQWKDGHSAKECAKAWLRTGSPQVPQELVALFDTHELTRHLRIGRAEPELETRLDDFRGNGRFHDLVAHGVGPAGRTLVCIEAKTNEPFGPIVSEARKAGTLRSGSKVPKRIEQLAEALFRDGLGSAVLGLRYQLVHAVAGTLIEAARERAALAVFVVHELRANGEAADAHRADLETFARKLADDPLLSVSCGQLYGPFGVPGSGAGGLVPRDL
ncbi:MAG: DUF6946 family protein, partial [Myxococcota bacterium]